MAPQGGGEKSGHQHGAKGNGDAGELTGRD